MFSSISFKVLRVVRRASRSRRRKTRDVLHKVTRAGQAAVDEHLAMPFETFCTAGCVADALDVIRRHQAATSRICTRLLAICRANGEGAFSFEPFSCSALQA